MNHKTDATRQEMEARENALLQLLDRTDYKALKAAEGTPSEDWDEVRANRQAWRKEVGELRAAIAEIG